MNDMSYRKLSGKFYFMLAIFLAMILGSAEHAVAQKDSLVLKNRDVIVGEIKSLNNGVIAIETSYSKNDFTIEWSGVREIHSKTRFLVTLKNGTRLTGIVSSIDSTGKLKVLEDSEMTTETTMEELVFLKGLKSDFWSRTSAAVDLGISLTRANNLRQYNSHIDLGYLADKWKASIYYNGLVSKQDNVDLVQRNEGGLTFTYYLQHDWFTSATLQFLSNTEQALTLRATGRAGAGKLFIHSNRAYWGAGFGLNYNSESFSNGTAPRKSLEGYVATEANIFDIGDFDFLGKWYVYPSITESGRWRSDLNVNAKYKFVRDFYVKAGLTLNYDNRPAAVGKETDYVFTFSVGWEL
jgi:small nuclear ribonucleoprotein (snRNP)-like protein